MFLHSKNWSTSWTVLEGRILTFFKDAKNLSSNSLVSLTPYSECLLYVCLGEKMVCYTAGGEKDRKHFLEQSVLSAPLNTFSITL